MKGEVYDKDTLILRISVGEAKGSDNSYFLSTNVNQSPLIESEKTGKFFSLSWQDIIELAIEAGIDET